MKRLLAYLFIVLGLGLTLSVNADDYPLNASVENQYDYTTQFLKDGDYSGAEDAFKTFLEINPNHKLSGNAQYWLAETFRVRQLNTDAAMNYLIGYQKYPKSSKAPINLLKLGVTLVQIGEKKQGCKMIIGMAGQYPNANVSVKEKAKYEAQKFNCDKRDKNYLAEIPKLMKEFDIVAQSQKNHTKKISKSVSLKLTKNEIDNLYSTVGSCWSIPLGLPYDKDLSVKIKVKLTPDGKITNTQILDYDYAKMNKTGNAYYRVLAESALRAIKLCEPFKGPKNKYDLWKEIVFNFDARDVLYGTESEETKIAKNNLLNKSTKTQIAKAEPTITPKKKVKVAKAEEPKKEEFKSESKNIDKDAPIIEIAKNFTVDSQTYTLKGKVKDKSKFYLEANGRPIELNDNGNFKLEGFVVDPEAGEEIKIVAIDRWNNQSEKIVNVKVEFKEVADVRTYEQPNPGKIRVKQDKNKIALIIGIEKYKNLVNKDAPYANRDANAFRAYANRALGIPNKNIKVLIDEEATRGETLKALTLWLPQVARGKGKDIFVFFAGHGLASDDGKNLFLLPQDGDEVLLQYTALSRLEIFDLINKVEPNSVTMFFDTCYSGQTRDEEMLVAGLRPIRLVAEEQKVQNNFTIFSASNYNQTSGSIEEAKHGIFSYYLMRGMEGNADSNNDKKITNGELIAYLKENVSEEAFINNREQEPMLSGDPDKVLISYR